MKQAILMILLFIFCIACNKDDDGGNPSTDEIVGTWRMVSFHYETEFNTGEVSGTITGEGFNINNVQTTFLPNGTIETNGNTFSVLLTTTIDGESTTEELLYQEPLEGSTWRREGNMLFFNHQENPVGEMGYPIRTINSTTLHLQGMVSSSMPMPVNYDILFERVN